MSLRRKHRLTLFLYGAYLILALFFSLGPIFEGPDEIEHYRYIRSIATQGILPNLHGQPRGEFHQAPLYYLLAAPLDSLLKDNDFAQIDASKNPFYGWLVYLPGNDNKNLYLHARAENFPFTGSETALSVHLIRLISIVLGLGTVITSNAIFRLLWPDKPFQVLLALSILVFWPQFLYISSTINNDNALIFLATVSFWLLLKQLQDGPSRRLAIWLGIALGGLFLSKVSGFFIIFPVGAAFALDRRSWRFLPIVMVFTL
nr:phospholipid carrier-dependent glycosyltransferase [Anaerolineae bacterium]